MQSIFLSKSKSIRSIMRSKTKWKNPIKGASWTIKRRPPIFDGFDHSFHPKDTPPWLDYFCSNNLRFWGFVFWEYIAIKQICLFEKKNPVHIYIYSQYGMSILLGQISQQWQPSTSWIRWCYREPYVFSDKIMLLSFTTYLKKKNYIGFLFIQHILNSNESCSNLYHCPKSGKQITSYKNLTIDKTIQ